MKISKCVLCGNEEDFNLNIHKMHPRDVEPIFYEARCECSYCHMSGHHVCLFDSKEQAKEAAIKDWNWRMEVLFKKEP